MNDDLQREHEQLLRQTQELQREHDRLAAQDFVDLAEHEAHKTRLRQKIEELHEHLQRIQRDKPE